MHLPGLANLVPAIGPSQDVGQVYAMQVLGDRLYVSYNYSIYAYDISAISMPKQVWKLTQADVGTSIS